MFSWRVAKLLLLLAFAGPRFASAADRLQFNRDVRPLLSANCYRCHGPDESRREAELRLDDPQSALAARDGGAPAIVPGDRAHSELWRRITSDDPDVRMPPPDAKLELTSDQIKLLGDWIQQGAEFEGHWAFLPPVDAALPSLDDLGDAAGFVRNPIDLFILEKLRSQGLRPSPEADRPTLIRRATFDLWGLPPSPDEVAAFVDDPRPDAYERLIDRLLQSPRFGERMTLAWMDAARYGDTSVFHADGPREMWPWRDWVLRAYNSNMPFDQFTVEQLAGDLLDAPTTDQLVATGFHRNHGTTDEGGAIDEEYRVEYIVDRVKTTSMVWLGLTMECGQCHDHKYDPLTQEDYYRFFAFFNQTPEKGMQTRNGNEEPRVPVPSKDERLRLAEFDAKLAELRDDLASARPVDGEIEAWIEQHRRNSGDKQPVLSGWRRLGPFRADSLDIAFARDFGPEKSVDLARKHRGQAWEEQAWQDGELISLGETSHSAVYAYRTISVTEPTKISLSLGSDDAISVWHNGQPVLHNKTTRGVAPDQESLELNLTAGSNDLLLKICNGEGPSGFYFRLAQSALPDAIAAAVRLPADERTAEQHELLRSHYTEKVWPYGRDVRAKIAAISTQRDEFVGVIPTVMVMQEMSAPRTTYILERGQYASPRKDRVMTPATPQFLPRFSESESQTRLDLARWLVHPEHPLTARVTVNRYWTMLFGRGIVATAADFGSQGAWPTHPELLDFLARDFVDHGWNVKRTLRRIMTSGTYRQSARVTAEHLARDPLNLYLARAPRLRLSAESIRDTALSLAGLLVERLGGPGVKPYQPPGLWNEVSLDGNLRFTQDVGEKLYRRTMYTYWKRSSPHPAMQTFDVPTREKCVIQRQRTNTPLQALVTLNDVQFVEAARAFAQRLLEDAADDDATRLDRALLMATGRPADAVRRDTLLNLLASERAVYAADHAAAKALLAIGESPRNTDLDAAQHAAWTIVASAILNLDETINKE